MMFAWMLRIYKLVLFEIGTNWCLGEQWFKNWHTSDCTLSCNGLSLVSSGSVEILENFNTLNFKTWKQMILFYLSIHGIARFLLRRFLMWRKKGWMCKFLVQLKLRSILTSNKIMYWSSCIICCTMYTANWKQLKRRESLWTINIAVKSLTDSWIIKW